MNWLSTKLNPKKLSSSASQVNSQHLNKQSVSQDKSQDVNKQPTSTVKQEKKPSCFQKDEKTVEEKANKSVGEATNKSIEVWNKKNIEEKINKRAEKKAIKSLYKKVDKTTEEKDRKSVEEKANKKIEKMANKSVEKAEKKEKKKVEKANKRFEKKASKTVEEKDNRRAEKKASKTVEEKDNTRAEKKAYKSVEEKVRKSARSNIVIKQNEDLNKKRSSAPLPPGKECEHDTKTSQGWINAFAKAANLSKRKLATTWRAEGSKRKSVEKESETPRPLCSSEQFATNAVKNSDSLKKKKCKANSKRKRVAIRSDDDVDTAVQKPELSKGKKRKTKLSTSKHSKIASLDTETGRNQVGDFATAVEKPNSMKKKHKKKSMNSISRTFGAANTGLVAEKNHNDSGEAVVKSKLIKETHKTKSLALKQTTSHSTADTVKNYTVQEDAGRDAERNKSVNEKKQLQTPELLPSFGTEPISEKNQNLLLNSPKSPISPGPAKTDADSAARHRREMLEKRKIRMETTDDMVSAIEVDEPETAYERSKHIADSTRLGIQALDDADLAEDHTLDEATLRERVIIRAKAMLLALEEKWSPETSQKLFSEEDLIELCYRAYMLLLNEESLVEVTTPVNVCGDIHGQFADLRAIFRAIGYPPKKSYIFLGDYVDRGCFSLEVLVLLFSLKILYPKQVIMLRGNHESSDVNVKYGFFREILFRYSLPLYDAFQRVFSVMPFAAQVDGRVLCMHGGISREIRELSQIKKIRRPCRIANVGVTCDLTWSDPNASVIGYQRSPRGASKLFGPDVVAKFCAKFGVDLIVRAHQVPKNGYEVLEGERLITIFSAPRYCDVMTNDASVLSLEKIGSTMNCSLTVFATRHADGHTLTESFCEDENEDAQKTMLCS